MTFSVKDKLFKRTQLQILFRTIFFYLLVELRITNVHFLEIK
jgi:hypothetical protein